MPNLFGSYVYDNEDHVILKDPKVPQHENINGIEYAQAIVKYLDRLGVKYSSFVIMCPHLDMSLVQLNSLLKK